MSQIITQSAPRFEPLAADLAAFTDIMEATASVAGGADGWKHPAQYAAEGMLAGFNTLMTAEGQGRMPELHKRALAYLVVNKLSMDAMQSRPSPETLDTIIQISPLVLSKIYQRLPAERQRRGRDFLDGVLNDVGPASTLRAAVLNRKGKRIMKGLEWVLGSKGKLYATELFGN